MKLIKRLITLDPEIRRLKEIADRAESDRRAATLRLARILDCAANATDDALGTLVGDKKNVVAHKR